MPFNVNNNTVVTDDRIVQSVSGAVGARPGTPVTGMTFFNTTDSIMEVYNGTAWISSTTGGGGAAAPNAWSWGQSLLGALGINIGNTSRSSPVSVVGGIVDWINIDAGGSHSLALRPNGTIYAWGNNAAGQLGDTTLVGKSSPVLVAGGIVDWKLVSGGNTHSLGLRANGTLYAWGDNTFGKLGDTTLVSKLSPVLVAGGFTDWTSAVAGDGSNLGLRATGQLYAWGLNNYGQVGDNTTTSRLSPVLVAGGIVDWVGVGAGSRFSLGVRATGTLYAWGHNNVGQLGDGTIVSKLSPVLVAGGFTDWTSAAGGGQHALGLRANGTVYAWGYAGQGRLGDNVAPANKSSPVLVVGGFTDWISISAGLDYSVGLRANGTVYGWGDNNPEGKLGDNSVLVRSSPVLVAGGFTNWIDITAGNAHTAALRSG